MMKKNNRPTPIAAGAPAMTAEPSNGHPSYQQSPELVAILESLQTMRDGDFSARLPGSWVGLPGKIADTFNDIAAANQQMGQELKRLGRSEERRVGKECRSRGAT